MAGLQEETIQATKEIGYNSIELQREAVSLIPKFQERFMTYYVPWAYPKLLSRGLTKMVDNYVDNVISATYEFSEQLANLQYGEHSTTSLIVLGSTGGSELRMQRQLAGH